MKKQKEKISDEKNQTIEKTGKNVPGWKPESEKRSK